MSGPCLSSSVTDHPLRSVIRRSLGEPLPHQQADRPRDHLKALCDRALILEKCYSRATSGINSTFAELSRTLRQVSHVLRTRSPLIVRKIKPKSSIPGLSHDLHVLSTPPAFVLSQNQTLRLIIYFEHFSIATESAFLKLLFSEENIKGSCLIAQFNFQRTLFL